MNTLFLHSRVTSEPISVYIFLKGTDEESLNPEGQVLNLTMRRTTATRQPMNRPTYTAVDAHTSYVM